jgi:hypothetical protein
LLRPAPKNKIFIFDEQTAVCYRIGISQLERIMPKGSVSRSAGWVGKVVSPSPKRKQQAAKFKNLMRENFPSTEQYREDVKAARVKKEIRADKSVMTNAKKTIRPAASAKKGTK